MSSLNHLVVLKNLASASLLNVSLLNVTSYLIRIFQIGKYQEKQQV